MIYSCEQQDILNWYEASLPSRERKMRGHFSTPQRLVEQILDACGYRATEDLCQRRVLDPACGSGNFLAGALCRLVAYGKRVGLDSASLTASVQHTLWGFDPDPVSCFLAEMQLRTTLEEATGEQTGESAGKNLHIHQADGLTLPWEQCQDIDLLLANPPYLAAKNNDLSGYRFAQRRGQPDSYLLFVELALQVVRPGGWLALVLPDPVLARANAAQERRKLLSQTTVHHLWHLSGVFAATVGAVVIIAQKNPAPSMHCISWTRAKWQCDEGICRGAISQSLLRSQPAAELRYLLSESQGILIENLRSSLCTSSPSYEGCAIAPLSYFVEIRRGEELAKKASLLTFQRVGDEHEHTRYPVVLGGVDVRPYSTPIGQCWIARANISKQLARYLTPKLLVVKSTGNLQAALDLNGHVVLQTLYLLTARGVSQQESQLEDPLDDLYFLLALLNSRLLKEYVRVLSTAYKWVQPQIEQHVLANLPIPTLDTAENAQIIQRAKVLMSACSKQRNVVELEESKQMYEDQEHAIEVLYHLALQAYNVRV